MNNVVCVQVIQSSCDTFDQLHFLLFAHGHIRVEQAIVETSTFAQFEHNARKLTVETHSECLHDVGMLLETAEESGLVIMYH